MAFARLKDSQIGIFAGSVIFGLTNNLFYPDLPVSLADLSAATDAYWSARPCENSRPAGRLKVGRVAVSSFGVSRWSEADEATRCQGELPGLSVGVNRFFRGPALPPGF